MITSIGHWSYLPKIRKFLEIIIVKVGYLMRTVKITGDQIEIIGDVNSTTVIEIIFAPVRNLNTISFNKKKLQTSRTKLGTSTATVGYNKPCLTTPNLAALEWKFLNSLPEIEPSYDDSAWADCSKKTTNNPRGLDTPTNLYSMDYGFHTWSLIYRGQFVSSGIESSFF